MIDSSSFEMPNPSKKLKCYIACTLKYIGVVNSYKKHVVLEK